MITILYEQLGFGIEEGLKKIEHAITFTEQNLMDRAWAGKCRSSTMLSGDLMLVITSVRPASVSRGAGAANRPLSPDFRFECGALPIRVIVTP